MDAAMTNWLNWAICPIWTKRSIGRAWPTLGQAIIPNTDLTLISEQLIFGRAMGAHL